MTTDKTKPLTLEIEKIARRLTQKALLSPLSGWISNKTHIDETEAEITKALNEMARSSLEPKATESDRERAYKILTPFCGAVVCTFATAQLQESIAQALSNVREEITERWNAQNEAWEKLVDLTREQVAAKSQAPAKKPTREEFLLWIKHFTDVMGVPPNAHGFYDYFTKTSNDVHEIPVWIIFEQRYFRK